jgi:uncharacterized protein (DUF3084 family)
MYGVFLILVLIVTGGAIAFIGDRLGSKIGKKRLSLFGLRPRHTSIVITILTGICITTLTFVAMAAVSENVRTALFGMERLNQTIRATESSLQTTSAALAAAQQEQGRTNEALEQSKDKVDRLQAQQAALEDRSRALAEGNRLLEAAKEELTQKNDALADDNAGLDARNTELMTGNKELMVDNNVLTAANGKLALDNTELEKRTDDLRMGIRIMREGDITYRAGEVLASGVIRGSRAEKDVRADMDILAQLANRNILQRLGENTADAEVWLYQPEYDKAISVISSSPQDMVVRIVAAGNLVRGEPVRAVLQLYKNSIIYRNHEFIIARPFKMTGKGNGEAEHVVMSFLQDVNAAAAARGILPDPIRGSVGVMEGTQFYDIVQAIAPLEGTIMLSAYARGDTDALGPLRLNLKLETEKP